MGKLIIEIPEQILRSAKIPPDEVNERFKQELAIRLFDQGILTLGKARELSGMSKWEFFRLIGRENIERTYDIEELEKDLKILDLES